MYHRLWLSQKWVLADIKRKSLVKDVIFLKIMFSASTNVNHFMLQNHGNYAESDDG